MDKSWIIIALLLLLPACYAGSERAGLEQCAGNHPDDSIAVWQQAVSGLAGTSEISSVAGHPSRNCISIGVADSSYIPVVEARLQEMGVPRDAVVIGTGETE